MTPRLPRTPVAAALVLGPFLLVSAADAQEGLTPEQMVRLRSVVAIYPNPAGDKLAFLRTSPRLAGDPPGPDYRHLYLLEQKGIDRRLEERLLIGGKNTVSGVAWDPRTGQLTIRHKADGDAHHQVYALSADSSDRTRVTNLPHGLSSYKWSPDGAVMAYVVTDQRSADAATAHGLGFRQRIVDEDHRHNSLWLWERGSGKSRRLTRGVTVNSFEWSPTGDRLAAGIAPRNLVDDRYMFTRLHTVEVATGKVERLVDNPGKLGAYSWSPDGRRLAYIGAADRNDPHAGMLWVVDVTTKNTRMLTRDFAGMVHDVHWHRVGGEDVLVSAISRGVATHLATFDPNDGTITREEELAAGVAFRGLHGHSGAMLGRFFIGSTARHPGEIYGAGFGPGYKRLTDSNPWLAEVALGRQRVVRIKARDGLEIEGILMYPVGHHSGERYPMVIVAHGGPESHFSNGWNTSYSAWGQMLAARGYFAWYPNYRASTGYGVAFAKADHGDPMGREFEDHLDAIAHFDAKGLIDPARVGIGGGSYGGYTAAWAATRHSEHFACAVSFVPFVDIRTKWFTSDIPWEFFLVHYQEKWPHEQPGLLADRSPLTWAHLCRTPLLLLGGTADPRVHPSQPHMLYRAVKFTTETPVRYVQYPGEGHGNRINVNRYDYCVRTLRWFDHYLAADASRDDPMPPMAIDVSAWQELGKAAEKTR